MKDGKLTKMEKMQCEQMAAYFNEAVQLIGKDHACSMLADLGDFTFDEIRGMCAVLNTVCTLIDVLEEDLYNTCGKGKGPLVFVR